MINVFVIDDHPMLIQGVETAFKSKQERIKISDSATSGRDALKKLKLSGAKVILLDLLMPEISGVELCSIIKRDYPEKKVIAFTGETDTALLYNALKSGVDAILMKFCGKEELVDAIYSVMAGNRVIGRGVPDLSTQIGISSSGKKIRLTKTEQQVLNKLAIIGLRKKAADELGMSKSAIDFHCKNIFKKFEKSNLVAVVKEARSANIL